MDTLPVLQPILHDPSAAPALNTSPETLGFTDSPVVPGEFKDSPSSSRVKRFSSAMEKTVDKLGRSISGKSSGSPSAGGHRRLFSMSRKGKATDRSDGIPTPSSTTTPSTSRPTSPRKLARPTPPIQDDSPFITPPSPRLSPTRPSLASFRGDGS
ncbi:hypothetical protein EDD18DRAFT_14835 [Armillaria luteobubalina]|uniref:Uncharacterized protein n=1 Tax=Armillaria luteobubalina TaxID=153913 RepID=A0AA39QQI5_9AGAR|nr:hypothetical protein EDD18DRAFT_14835 [Armillaria luteobubalina]